ncbi:MAG: sodium/solute symporter [Candidatus Aminicenantales bacterium]
MGSSELIIPTLDLVIIVAYLVGIMTVGILVGYKRRASSQEFFLAGKTLRWPMIGAALFTANISTIHLVGLAADGYRIGLVVGNFEWMASFTLIILGLVFAPFYFRSRLQTLPEYLEKRYGPSARTIMAFIAILGALLIHIGISLYAGAKVLEHFFGINMYVSIIVIASVTATYTIIGGLKAVVVTDTIQAVLLLGGAATLTWIGLTYLPDAGIHSLADLKAAVKPGQMNMIHALKNPATGQWNEYSWLTVMLGYFVLGIWYWCTDQTIVQKVLGARSEKDGRNGAIFAGFLKILPVFLMVFPGVIAYVLFRNQISEPNDTLLVMMRNLLPTGLRGLMAAGLLAALMSTIEAALNSTATVTAEDIVKRLRPKTRDRTLVLIGRVTATVVILLAMAWSTQGGRFASIFVAVNKIPMMFAPAITTVFLLGVFWRRGTKEAALATLLFGAVVGGAYFLVDLPAFGDIQWITNPEEGLGIPYMGVGLLLLGMCFLVFILVSWFTPKPSESQLKDLCWDKPRQIFSQGKIRGITDTRVMATLLFLVMIALYALFH